MWADDRLDSLERLRRANLIRGYPQRRAQSADEFARRIHGHIPQTQDKRTECTTKRQARHTKQRIMRALSPYDRLTLFPACRFRRDRSDCTRRTPFTTRNACVDSLAESSRLREFEAFFQARPHHSGRERSAVPQSSLNCSGWGALAVVDGIK